MQQEPVAREKLFNMRMSDEEWARLDFLAEHFNLNAAGVLRMLVKREFDAVKASLPVAPPPPPKARR
jgi:hypothetical protein